jgi:hypothetical protein
MYLSRRASELQDMANYYNTTFDNNAYLQARRRQDVVKPMLPVATFPVLKLPKWPFKQSKLYPVMDDTPEHFPLYNTQNSLSINLNKIVDMTETAPRHVSNYRMP